MTESVFQYIFYLGIVLLLAIPLGNYIGKVMNGETVFLSKIIVPVEQIMYRFLGIEETEQMTGRTYGIALVVFNLAGFLLLWFICAVQEFLPGNPQHIPGMSWSLGLNTAVSFITNTNWQAYSGEAQVSYFTQMFGLTVQNFLSAATGIAVLFVLIRGFVTVKNKGLGNYWVDMVRIVLYILLPLSLVFSVGLVSQGVVQTFQPAVQSQLSEPVAVDKEGTILDNAVIHDGVITVDGTVVGDGKIIDKQFIPLGPAASQIAIKQLGTNGGGFFGVNSAHPFENPTWFSNLLETISLLLIPMALCFTFGRNIRDKRQGRAIFMAMFILLVVGLAIIAVNEQQATTALVQPGVNISTAGQAGGNMEGKEVRFGIVASAVWTSFTTAASNGSVNSMLDSYTPLGGMIAMLQMQLGEVIFGGVGSGLYGMLGFVIVTVFIAGLMVGRTPEYLGKKIEPFEMKWAVLLCLATPIAILVSSGIAVLVPDVYGALHNEGAHGFSEVLYTYSSAGGNNGSAFAGFAADNPFINVSTTLVMLFGRFLPIISVLAIAGSMANKSKIATTAGTLSTCNSLFVFLLMFIVLLVGALSFFPALALGPIAEFFQIVS